MRYTLWSRGRLVGETDLGFVFRFRSFRCGWFHPTALGERLMPAATGVAPALRTRCMIGPDPTAEADVLSAVDQEVALELELRGPDGAPIATESIAIVDTHYLLELARSEPHDEEPLDPETDARIEADVEAWWAERDEADLEQASEEEESELPRYQIQVELVDPLSVP